MGAGAVAAATIGSAVIGAGTSLYGSSKASSGAKDAANLQTQQYQQTRSDLLPYNTTGQNALTQAYDVASSGQTGGGPDYITLAQSNMPGTMSQAELEDTPGYRWARREGLRSIQSGVAARGLGVSGASLRGAAKYATGLADSTYQNQFNNAQQRFTDYINLNVGQQSNLTNRSDRLYKLAALGENAAAATGVAGTSAASTAGSYLNAAGLDTASGVKSASNALTSGVNNYLGYKTMQDYLTSGYNTPTNNINSTYTNPAEQKYYSAASSGGTYNY